MQQGFSFKLMDPAVIIRCLQILSDQLNIVADERKLMEVQVETWKTQQPNIFYPILMVASSIEIQWNQRSTLDYYNLF
jgi:hypothetical protein